MEALAQYQSWEPNSTLFAIVGLYIDCLYLYNKEI